MPVWMKEKLFQKQLLQKSLAEIDSKWETHSNKLLFTEHHQAHAASAFYPSPFDEAIVLTVDGVGEWATTSIYLGERHELKMVREIKFPHSLGLLYSAFTYYTGFKVNSGEYKVMGLAPYGEPNYVKTILNNLIDVKEDGSFALNMEYFSYVNGLTMTNKVFDNLFGGPPRKPETKLSQKEMDLACSIQVVLEEVMLRMVKNIHKEFHSENLCLAGGVALNCVANGRIIRETPIKRIWIQPAAGDAGGAVGAAFSTWHQFLNNPLHPKKNDMMKGAFLGPCYVGDAIHSFLEKTNAEYYLTENSELYKNVAKILAQEKVVGWFQGRMEFGPRALGCRSILGDPRSSEMQSTMNLKIKYRESFRPFAPSVLFDKASSYFDINCESPYMLLVAKLLEKHRVKMTAEDLSLWGIDKLKLKRSSLPAITHLDYSARLQTVHPDTNPKYYQLISAFYELTGCPVLVNTSFNVRGEPIVCTPEDAYRCFMRTEMDVLVLENYILYKEEQPAWEEDGDWQTEFELD